MTQLAMTAMDNKNLFSNYYLDNQLKNNLEWKKEEHKAAFSEIKKLYESEKDFIPTLNEKQLEQRFFAPIFKILNHTVEVNEGTEMGEFPDYAFFPDRNSLDDSHKKKGTILFYNNAFAIGEVKRWGIELDRFGKDEKDRKRNPSLQIWIYLHDVSPKWGILSNGAKWRLYCKDRRRDDYFEIDLPTLLATNDIENFRYFYYFFRRDAFLPSKEGRNFLDDVLKGSADYAKEIGNDLKENVYKAMKKVAEGFFNWPENRLDVTNEDARDKIQKNTMILLYRLLFLLYAEGKGLLNLRDIRYESYSFDKLKKIVKEKQDGPVQGRYMPIGMELLSRLKSLFRLINQGSEALGIPKNEFYVPAYNGGLFDPEKHPELEKWIIGDLFLADAIDLLSRSRIIGGGKGFVDYSTLEIRHLGSIYEGLLEYKLQVADEDMVVNGGEWLKLEEFNKDRKQKKVFSDFDEFDRVKKGQIFLATDKGERKATGSYYTPDYIVNYIVKNTVGPVVDEKWKEAESNKKSFIDATLSVKVLDPAMGSGHFLVGSIEYLSDRLLKAAQEDINAGRLTEESHLTHDWARREVVAHCIYGVDMNPMAVELAKVGLWLTTISNTKPLSFLDHRLKQGNSLIGAKLEDLSHYPDVNAKKKERKAKDAAQQTFEVDIEKPFFIKIVNILKSLTDINDDSIENINKKKNIFKSLLDSLEYQKIKAFANLHTAIYFGNEATKDSYGDILWGLRGDEKEWRRKTNREWFGKARKLSKEKSFFNWELEFPEIFFEGGSPKENPGWDAVVGNPPYGFHQIHSDFVKPYLKNHFVASQGSFEHYFLFYEKALVLLKKNGIHGYIVPVTWLTIPSASSLRQFILENYRIKEISWLPELVFANVQVNTLISIIQNSPNNNVLVRKFDTLGFHYPPKEEHIYPQLQFVQSNHTINIFENETDSEVLDKISTLSSPLEEFARPCSGYNPYEVGKGQSPDGGLQTKETVFSKPYHSKKKIGQDWKPEIIGRDLGRYSMIISGDRWIKYGPWLAASRDPENFVGRRILVQEITGGKDRRNIATYYEDELYYSRDVIPIKIENNNIHPFYLLSIINSGFIAWYHLKRDPKAQKGLFPKVLVSDLKNIPIRRISFTTPADRCAALAAEAKALYSEFLGAPGADNLDRINRIDRINVSNPVNPVHPVQTVASLSAAPDSRKILEFIGARLSAAPEESDVVHDLLAYLQSA